MYPTLGIVVRVATPHHDGANLPVSEEILLLLSLILSHRSTVTRVTYRVWSWLAQVAQRSHPSAIV